jgi:2-oxoglutarate dehydrogenase E1 component
VLLCSGKVYYDLLAERAKRATSGGDQVAIVRVEQLAPLPGDEIAAAVGAYPQAELVWVQEEPANQGPWPFMALNLPARLGGRGLSCISRPASASPAAGSHKKHDLEQRGLVEQAFTLPG